MRFLVWIGSPVLLTVAFWSSFVACIDAPAPEIPPAARIVAAWDPLACGEPHRVVVELEDEAGVMIAASTRCASGMLTLDAPHYGIYRGRLYAWELETDVEIRSVMAIHMAVDEPIVRWWVATPP
jgi:hypothetical protein